LRKRDRWRRGKEAHRRADLGVPGRKNVGDVKEERKKEKKPANNLLQLRGARGEQTDGKEEAHRRVKTKGIRFPQTPG